MNAIFFASMLFMVLLAMSFAAAPLIRTARTSSHGFTNVPLLTVLATSLLAVGLYAAIGRPDVATGAQAHNSVDTVAQKRSFTNTDAKAASVSELLAGLEKRLQEDPENAKDWLLLAWGSAGTLRTPMQGPKRSVFRTGRSRHASTAVPTRPKTLPR